MWRRVAGDGTPATPGEPGLTPYIGPNGNWWTGTVDSGVPARGPKGDPSGAAGGGVALGDVATVAEVGLFGVPCGSTSTAARSVLAFIAPYPCKLRYLSIVAASPALQTGTSTAADGTVTGGQWTVNVVKVVPAGYRTKRDVLVVAKDGNRESKSNPGEIVVANVPWDLDPILFAQVDPAGLAVPAPPPYVLQKGDHLRVDFVPSGPSPGTWGASAFLQGRVEPYDKASDEVWT
jgi:hypothetical protein